MQLAARPGSPESLQQLVEIVKNPSTAALSGIAIGKDDATRQVKDKKVTEDCPFTHHCLLLILQMFIYLLNSSTGGSALCSKQGRVWCRSRFC